MLDKAECVYVKYRSPKVTTHTRLKGHHFPEILPNLGGKKQLHGVVCGVYQQSKKYMKEQSFLKIIWVINLTYNVNSVK